MQKQNTRQVLRKYEDEFEKKKDKNNETDKRDEKIKEIN